jgi:hypothetical protein
VDDLTVFDNDKKRLWEMKEEMEAFLAGERLKLHPQKTFVAPVSIGIDHLGYRVFPTHRRLRKETSMAFVRNLRSMGQLCQQGRIPCERLNASVQSWLGHAKHADTYGLRKSLFGRPLLSRTPITLGFVPQA